MNSDKHHCKEDCECEEPCEDCSCENNKPINLENLDEETQRKIQELQMMEQNMQQFLMQKQAFVMELDETDLCLQELKTAKGEIFKIVGNKLVIKTTREEQEKELDHKKELIILRIKTMEKQEQEFMKKVEELRQEIIQTIQNK